MSNGALLRRNNGAARFLLPPEPRRTTVSVRCRQYSHWFDKITSVNDWHTVLNFTKNCFYYLCYFYRTVHPDTIGGLSLLLQESQNKERFGVFFFSHPAKLVSLRVRTHTSWQLERVCDVPVLIQVCTTCNSSISGSYLPSCLSAGNSIRHL